FWVAILLIGGVGSAVLEDVDRHERIQVAFRNGRQFCSQQLAELQTEAMKDDWRPTVSYIANLSRIGEQLLGTNKSWETLYAWMPPETRAQFLYNNVLSPQFPWYWCGAVLIALFGLSACILNFQIKSLAWL